MSRNMKDRMDEKNSTKGFKIQSVEDFIQLTSASLVRVRADIVRNNINREKSKINTCKKIPTKLFTYVMGKTLSSHI